MFCGLELSVGLSSVGSVRESVCRFPRPSIAAAFIGYVSASSFIHAPPSAAHAGSPTRSPKIVLRLSMTKHKQSSIASLKEALLPSPDEPGPAEPRHPLGAHGIKAKQGTIDAAKGKPAVALQRGVAPAALDVERLLSRLTLKLSLPTTKPRKRLQGWEQRRAERPGTFYDAMALLRLDKTSSDEHPSVKCDDIESQRNVLSLQPKASAIEAAKQQLQPWRPSAAAPLTTADPAGTLARRGSRAHEEEEVDVWDSPPQGRGKRNACTALFGGLQNLFRFIAQPPLQGAKLLVIFPSLLLWMWFSIVKTLPLGPLASFAALSLSLPVIVAQCYAIAFPLTGAIALLALQIGEIVDAAFVGMQDSAKASIRVSLAVVKLPEPIETRLVTLLMKPLETAINVVRGLMPNFGTLFPESWRSGGTLAPIMFVLLLGLLILAQVVPLLMLGLAGTGDLAILMACAIQIGMGLVALNAHRVLELAVAAIQFVINTTLQFLLRRVINVRRLQMLADAAHDPKKALGLSKKGEAEATRGILRIVPWSTDTTLATGCELELFSITDDEVTHFAGDGRGDDQGQRDPRRNTLFTAADAAAGRRSLQTV